MKLELKDIPAKLLPLIDKAKEYAVFIAVLAVLFAYGFLILQIRHFVNLQPTETAVNEKLKDLKTPRVDKEAIEKIQKLESSNVEVKSLFDHARDNPFQE